MTLLNLLMEHGGSAPLSVLAADSGLSLPTVHRLLRALASSGYVQQLSDRRYTLGAKLIPLGTVASRMLGASSSAYLSHLVRETGETANLAMLDGASVVYVAQVPSGHSMRMFTEVGRRVEPHASGVGKAILARLTDTQVLDLVGPEPLEGKTARTITSHAALLDEMARIRSRGYAIDDGEQEVGVRCIATAVPTDHVLMAVSISGPESRVTQLSEQVHVPLLQEVARQFASGVEQSPLAARPHRTLTQTAK